MLSNHGFDLWANTYDASVRSSEQNNAYPFAGYTALMNAIYGTVMNRAHQNVLDIGFGTALLTSKLYDAGHIITGLDFSPEMIQIAQAKMPNAQLILHDFAHGIPAQVQPMSFDFIISTYALHHLTDEAKAAFISSLLGLLSPSGSILIGDVGFPSRYELELCKEAEGDSWDDEEYYFVFSELYAALHTLCSLTFHPYSHCSGVIEIRT